MPWTTLTPIGAFRTSTAWLRRPAPQTHSRRRSPRRDPSLSSQQVTAKEQETASAACRGNANLKLCAGDTSARFSPSGQSSQLSTLMVMGGL